MAAEARVAACAAVSWFVMRQSGRQLWTGGGAGRAVGGLRRGGGIKRIQHVGRRASTSAMALKEWGTRDAKVRTAFT
jgi:hypothetical protein